jgi:hypothetical protein
LGESDENAFGPGYVAEPVCGLVLGHLTADEIRTVVDQPVERVVDVVHGEHHTEVAQGVHRGVPVISDHLRHKEARELEPAVAVRRAHLGDLVVLVAQAGDAPCPLALDVSSAFELEAELTNELDRRCEVFDDDADVAQPEGRQVASLRVRPERHLSQGRCGSTPPWGGRTSVDWRFPASDFPGWAVTHLPGLPAQRTSPGFG